MYQGVFVKVNFACYKNSCLWIWNTRVVLEIEESYNEITAWVVVEEWYFGKSDVKLSVVNKHFSFLFEMASKGKWLNT